MQQTNTAPNVSTQRLRNQFCAPDGKGRLTYTALLPVIEGHTKINDFYKRLATECEKYCQGKLLQLCCNEAHGDAAWEYSYRLTFKPCVDNDRVEICVTATLYDKASRRIVKSYSEGHLWSLYNDMMIPKNRERKK